MLKITSLYNEKIKKIVKLRNKRYRDKIFSFVIEDLKEISSAYNSNIEIDSIFIEKKSLFDEVKKFLDLIKSKKIPVFECSDKVFEKISYKKKSSGIIAIAKQFRYDIKDLEGLLNNNKKSNKNPFLLVCQSIEKPGNLGAILRTANAAGCLAVVVVDQSVDIFNPNVIRASKAALFYIPVITTKSDELLAFFKKNDIKIIATSPGATTIYSEMNLKKAFAFVIGREDKGLCDMWLQKSDFLVKIPMFGKVDSLNAANTAAILLYETIRQRNAKHY